jgi:hypothetical protein
MKCPLAHRGGNVPLQDVDVAPGTELVISPPDPPLSPEFLTALASVFGGDVRVDQVYLFDVLFPTGETSLMIGIVPSPEVGGIDALDPLFLTAMGCAQDEVGDDRQQVDFLCLDDPEMRQVVISTVAPLPLGR